jgi:hypothetical protein
MRCGDCDYCRSTKQIKGVMSVFELDPGQRPPRVPDYAAPDIVPDGVLAAEREPQEGQT